MKTKGIGFGLAFLMAALLVVNLARSQSVPQLINYQGRLTNASGLPLDGDSVNLTFRFYGVQSGPSPLYLTVLQQNVLVSKGIYNVLIGSGTPTPGTEKTLADVFQRHPEVWMGVQVNTDPELAPRSRISSVPYALSLDVRFLGDFVGKPDWDGDGYKKAPYDGNTVDCNDGDPSVYPGAPELCDGHDNQCPGDPGYGFIDEGCPGVCTDQDHDGYFMEAGCESPVDCNDHDPLTYPGAPEICDGMDNNCDGNVDEGIPPQSCYSGPPGTEGVGSCHGGPGTCLGGAWWCEGEVTPQSEVCNGLDDDCNGVVDNGILPTSCYTGPPDTQGMGICQSGTQACVAGSLVCTGEITPQPEVCNGLDDNCDGIFDNGIPQPSCYSGSPETEGVGICHAGIVICNDGIPFCMGEITPQAEVCNGLDNNCDGFIDEGCQGVCTDQDGDGFFKEAGCETAVDCNDYDPFTRPGVPEICDGMDNNCDGNVDEGIPSQSCYSGPPGTEGVGSCHGGTGTCVGGAWWCEGEVTPQPEVCNGLDDNCDGFIDEGCPVVCTDQDGDGYFKETGCSTAVDCNDYDSFTYPGAPEICDGQDNNCDGNVDEGLCPNGVCDSLCGENHETCPQDCP